MASDAPNAPGDAPNEKVYIHELIDIRGHNRAKYMHHMTANWVPVAIEERNQLCYGVWGTVGSTGRWPEVVNVWELDGWDGLVANFRHEFVGRGAMQDPSLAEWWAQAAEFRSGGYDRILTPAPWTRPIGALVADGVRGEVYAHELVAVPPGEADDYLDALQREGRSAVESFGLTLTGAFRVEMVNDTECIVIWAIPDWSTWAAFERAHCSEDDGTALAGWAATQAALGADWRRTLMVEAPLSPLRLGRQPEASDRRPLDQV
jgi:hypothetical protein